MKSVSLILFLPFLAARGSPRGQNRRIVIETCSPDQYGSYEYNIAIFCEKKNFFAVFGAIFRGVSESSRLGERKVVLTV